VLAREFVDLLLQVNASPFQHLPVSGRVPAPFVPASALEAEGLQLLTTGSALVICHPWTAGLVDDPSFLNLIGDSLLSSARHVVFTKNLTEQVQKGFACENPQARIRSPYRF
jgi:hypothetical protein